MTLAKCNMYSASFCKSKHDAEMCKDCILVNRRDALYKFVNGHKLKRCPRCKEYKMLHEFEPNSKGHVSWCKKCKKNYSHIYRNTIDKKFMIGHKVDDKMIFTNVNSSSKMMRFVREHLIENNETIITIKRI